MEVRVKGLPPGTSGSIRLTLPPTLGYAGPQSGATGGFRDLCRRVGLRLPPVLIRSIPHQLRATTGLFSPSAQLVASLRSRQLSHALCSISGHPEPARGGFCLCPVSPGVAGLGASLPRPLPRPGPRRQVFRARGRMPTAAFLCLQPKTASWSVPNRAGFCPAERPPQETVTHSQPRPGVEAGGGSVEAAPSGYEYHKSANPRQGKSARKRAGNLRT